MTTPPRTPTTAAAPSLMPTLIHECGHGTVVRLPDDWQQRVESGWYAIPIVACGNPWHYANLDRPAIEAEARAAPDPAPLDMAGCDANAAVLVAEAIAAERARIRSGLSALIVHGGWTRMDDVPHYLDRDAVLELLEPQP